MSLRSRISSIFSKSIPDVHYSQDANGNHWYTAVENISNELNNKRGLASIVPTTDYDMTDDVSKLNALSICTPLALAVDKRASMFANGKIYIQDEKGNEPDSLKEERALLKRPNFMQTEKQFLKQVEATFALYGFCPIYTLRPIKSGLPKQLWVIPPYLFKIKTNGKIWKQTKFSEIVEEVYIEGAGVNKTTLEEHEYYIIYDSEAILFKNGFMEFVSKTDSLSVPVSNWVAQAVASNTLIVNGGPKGILYNNDASEFANASLTPKEKDEINSKFKKDYGLVGQAFSVLVTNAKLGWLPLNYDSGQMKLHEEDARSANVIYNALGLNPNIFNSNSTYANLEVAEKTAYTNTVIPDATLIGEALTQILKLDKYNVVIDYSHISVLQDDRQAEAQTLVHVANALGKLMGDKVLSVEEVRMELSKYLDINPDDKTQTDE